METKMVPNDKQIFAISSIKAAGLSAFWLNRVAALWVIQQTLTDRQHGQLKRLKKSLGYENAKEVIEYVLHEWGSFVKRAGEIGGAVALPAKPNVGFLAKYQAIALSMTQQHLQAIAKKKAAEMEAAKIKTKIMEKKPMAIIQLTNDQVMAFLQGDESYDAFFDAITEKYGEWRPAKWAEKGIPCEIELKLAG